MPLAARRTGRAGVVGPRPVARTAATVGTVAVVAHGVHRRSDRREDRREDRERRPARRPQGPSPVSRPRTTTTGQQPDPTPQRPTPIGTTWSPTTISRRLMARSLADPAAQGRLPQRRR